MPKSALSLALSAALFTGAALPVSVFSQEVEPVVAEMSGNYLQGEVMVVNTETRLMTLKDADGVYHVLHVPPQVSRIDQIKIGDKVTITEVSSALIGLTPTDAGTPIAMDTSIEVDRDAGSKPSGTMTETLTVTGEIIGVNKAAGTVTVKGPNATRTFDVDDPALLEGVKVGDGVIAKFRNVIVGEVKSGYTRKPGPPTP
ncbi:MAG: copper-binding protein [Thiohalocapsa sp.]